MFLAVIKPLNYSRRYSSSLIYDKIITVMVELTSSRFDNFLSNPFKLNFFLFFFLAVTNGTNTFVDLLILWKETKRTKIRHEKIFEL